MKTMTLYRMSATIAIAALLFLYSPQTSAQSRLVFPESDTTDVETGEESGAGNDVSGNAIDAETVDTETVDTEMIDPNGGSRPDGFGAIELGLDVETTKQRLRADSNFLFRGDPDVSMLREPNETLIEAVGSSYIKRGYFQFYEKKLYTIILELDVSRMDHYTMYTTFVSKYGEPAYLDPTQTVWEFTGVRLSLERPLRVKYIDTVVFDRILVEQNRTESLGRMTRDAFLGGF